MKRIYHPWHEWECYPAGFYETVAPGGMSTDEAKLLYCEFLRDTERFKRALERVTNEWPNSCEHFLSNPDINRIAWLGQASMCIATGVPSCFRGGFHLLAADEKTKANAAARATLKTWLAKRSEPAESFCLQNDTPEAREGKTPQSTTGRIHEYIARWIARGYPQGIPDEVPNCLMVLGLAPSYKAICIAILKNDMQMTALGFASPVSKWYGVLKRIEIRARVTEPEPQREFAL